MTLRHFVITNLTSAALIGTANTASADIYSEAVQCIALIQLTSQGQPADYPAMAKVNVMIDGWKAHAEIVAFPEAASVDADVENEQSTFESKMMEFMGDPTKTQAYFGPIGARCSTPPPDAIKPDLCKGIANGEVEAAKLGVDMLRYNLSLESGLKAQQTRADIAVAEEEVVQAEAAASHFESAGQFTLDADTQKLLFDHEARKAAYQTCLKQMG